MLLHYPVKDQKLFKNVKNCHAQELSEASCQDSATQKNTKKLKTAEINSC